MFKVTNDYLFYNIKYKINLLVFVVGYKKLFKVKINYNKNKKPKILNFQLLIN